MKLGSVAIHKTIERIWSLLGRVWAQRSIGNAIGISDHRCCSLSPTAFHEVTVQRLAAGYQAIVAIWWRERRQKRECLAAEVA